MTTAASAAVPIILGRTTGPGSIPGGAWVPIGFDAGKVAFTSKAHISIAPENRACLAAQRVLFRTATKWVARLADAQRQGKLDDELASLERIRYWSSTR